jgi:hypothetical protein
MADSLAVPNLQMSSPARKMAHPHSRWKIGISTGSQRVSAGSAVVGPYIGGSNARTGARFFTANGAPFYALAPLQQVVQVPFPRRWPRVIPLLVSSQVWPNQDSMKIWQR